MSFQLFVYSIPLTSKKSVLIAADDALESAVDSKALSWRSTVDKKFRDVIDLLSDFAKDFALKDLTSDPNIGETVTGEVRMSDKSRSAMTILQALKNNLHSNVKFPYLSSFPNVDEIPANGL